MAKAKKKVLKVKKKQWVEILAPKIFNEALLGRTYVVNQEDAVGKHITVNLMNLTRDPKKQSINVSFIIDNIKGEKLTTSLVKYAFQPTSIRRMVRRSKDRVDSSFIAATKDKIKVKIKPILVTRAPTSKPVQTSIRKKARQVVVNELAKITYDKFMEELIQRQFQRRIFDQVKKVFPLSVCDIRVAQIVPESKAQEEQAPSEEPVKEIKTEEISEKKEEIKKEEAKPEVKKEEPKAEEKEAKPEEKKVESVEESVQSKETATKTEEPVTS